MSKARGGVKSQQGRLADMSLPAEERGRLADMSLPAEERGRRGRGKRQAKRVGGTPPAQLGHASGGRARRHAREGERKMERSRSS